MALCDVVCRGLLLLLEQAGEIGCHRCAAITRPMPDVRCRPKPLQIDTIPLTGPGVVCFGEL